MVSPLSPKNNTLGTQTNGTNERDKWTNKFLNLPSSSDNFGESNFEQANKYGQNFKIYISEMARNALKLSTMVGEIFEICISEMARNALKCPP